MGSVSYGGTAYTNIDSVSCCCTDPTRFCQAYWDQLNPTCKADEEVTRLIYTQTNDDD